VPPAHGLHVPARRALDFVRDFASPAATDLETFRTLLARRLGLHFGDDKHDLLGDLVRQGMLAAACSDAGSYLSVLEGPGRAWDRLVESVTVGETYFFRQWDQFRALIDVVLPLRLRERSQERRLCVLSAGCASGEEAYSLAMIFHSRFPELDTWNVDLKGVDVNPASLAKAADGLYSAWALRDTPMDLREHFFTRTGNDFKVKEEFRTKVAFECRNLSQANDDLWRPDHYDFIFCRNMLMYCTPDAMKALVARMTRALVPGGFLFLGYAETLRGLPGDLGLCNSNDAFYYQRLPQGRPNLTGAAAPGLPDSRPAPAVAAGPWDSVVPMPAAPNLPAPDAPLEKILDFTKRGRFLEALEAMPESDGGPDDTLLLRAVLLANLGCIGEAEAVCNRILGLDRQNAGPHYVLALCREYAGDPQSAIVEDTSAINLDAGFAMPWLHLGLLARRDGHPAQARRHFEQALALLPHEHYSRVLFFSGGLGREGLTQLCRSSLRSLEAGP